MRGALSIVVATVLVLGALLAATSGAATTVHPSAYALVAGGDIGAQGEAHAEDDQRDRARTGQLLRTGVAIRAGDTSVRTSVQDGLAHATAGARTVALLDGRITAYGVRRTVTATADGKKTYKGRIEGLKIDGQTIGDVEDAQTIGLADGAGRVVLNKGTSGIRVVLKAAAGGLPAGTDIRIAVAGAAVKVREAPVVTPTPIPTPSATPTPDGGATSESGGRARKTGLKRKKAPTVDARLTKGGFAFPIYGKARVADNFGAARAAPIVAHEGNDIFADFGSPVVAVADGTVSRVGTLDISGNRLWVTTKSGDAFFYAHLSAFSPAAVDGAKVKAGTVLGFVGNTGDAEPTPPHLHFEVHPGGEEEDAVDPYRILTSWQGAEDVAPGAWLQRNGADTTERPGALVAVQDFIAQ
jgi:murein DD-endopeptidase MepM/ murein hydrolase activator NlpD